jgi:hypothetical protein
MKNILLLLILLISNLAFCQHDFAVEGRVIDSLTREPVPFARIFNRTTKQGTISSEDGYFRIELSNSIDSVEVRVVGYKTMVTNLNPSFNTILLEPNAKDLSEIEISVADDAGLFDLLQKCSKYRTTHKKAKGYYTLASYLDTAQVELVEGYYNLGLENYDLDEMDLKSGRLALQTFNDRFFTSQSGSNAISQLRTFNKNDFFPQTPLNLKKKEAKTLFRLELLYVYVDENLDSVYVIKYRPKGKSSNNFEGRIWLNINQALVQKITMNCSACEIHPFLPIFPTDSINNVDMRITKTFSISEGLAVFNHVDFSYRVNYVSRPGKEEQRKYAVETKAVLYAYDIDSSFQLPNFNFGQPTNDYRKINAFPYNSFFWEMNDEFDLNHQNDRNQAFFNHPASMTNVQFFKSSNANWKYRNEQEKKSGYLEHPYVHWSKNRVFLREMIADTSTSKLLSKEKSLLYNLDVQLFMDINLYGDSLNFLTETVFDPYNTYYYLPIDNHTNCFINMYFDLCEIQRRELEKKLFSVSNPTAEKLQDIYNDFLQLAQKEREQFLKEVDRGTIRKAMEKWNAYILLKVGNDNMLLFGVSY